MVISRTSRGFAPILVAGLILAGAATGCSDAGPAGGSPTPSPTAVSPTPSPGATTATILPTTPPTGPATTTTGVPPVVSGALRLDRSGGLAGVRQLILIETDGTWRYQDIRASATQEGKLTAEQRTQLIRLIADPAFRTEMAQKPPTDVCNDGYVYVLTIGEARTSYDDCVKDRPAIRAVVTYVLSATPM